MDVAITTDDVRGATVLAMEGFWHPDAGADFDRWLAGVKAETLRDAAEELESAMGTDYDTGPGDDSTFYTYYRDTTGAFYSTPEDMLRGIADRLSPDAHGASDG